MAEFSKTNHGTSQAALGPIFTYKSIQIGWKPCQIRVEQRFDRLIETLLGDKVNVRIFVVKEDQERFHGQT
jgi:hypothetical protein